MYTLPVVTKLLLPMHRVQDQILPIMLPKQKSRFVTNGPVRLYYDNVEKFATAGSGATVYGTFTADTLSVSGISTFTGDIDVDGHTNLDNASIAGVSTFEGSFVRMELLVEVTLAPLNLVLVTNIKSLQVLINCNLLLLLIAQ